MRRERLVPTVFCRVIGVGLVTWVLLASAAMLPASAAPSSADSRVLPLPNAQVVRRFQAPAQNWLAGHRGVDLAGSAGQSVRAASDGVVRWVGVIDGTPGISIQHADGTVSTYQPVSSSLARGTQLQAGMTIGNLQAGHEGCSAAACLHWGIKTGDQYLDPMTWLSAAESAQPGGGRVRLLPLGAKPRRAPAGIEFTGEGDTGYFSGLPLAGTITSPFGPRLNPITGNPEMHTGVDISAGCGAPIRANASGVITRVGWLGGYGLRVELVSGDVTWSFSHLSEAAVSAGDRVTVGQLIGLEGTTGFSTGCHLHFEKFVGGSYVNPLG